MNPSPANGSSLLEVAMVPQPTDTSCGPTCLHALYHYYGQSHPLERILAEVPMLETGGTLAVNLGSHALQQGFRVHLLTFNLRIFDPTWFPLGRAVLVAKLRTQLRHRRAAKARHAVEAYLRFLELGGEVELRDISTRFLCGHLDRGHPILTGLNATYLYRCCREMPDTGEDDDERGGPLGHFVIIAGYDRSRREFLIADPYEKNPLHRRTHYAVSSDRLINAILLGILTYDANLLILEPPR
jgi:hypothetical protein